MNTSFLKKKTKLKLTEEAEGLCNKHTNSSPNPPLPSPSQIPRQPLFEVCCLFSQREGMFFKKILRFRTVLFRTIQLTHHSTWLPFLPCFSGCHLAWVGDKIPGNTWNVDKLTWLLSKQNNQNGRERLGLEKHADVPSDESRLDEVEGARPRKRAKASHQSPRETDMVGERTTRGRIRARVETCRRMDMVLRPGRDRRSRALQDKAMVFEQKHGGRQETALYPGEIPAMDTFLYFFLTVPRLRNTTLPGAEKPPLLVPTKGLRFSLATLFEFSCLGS